MAHDEASRHHVHTMAARCMDDRAADALMEMLPPVGWADVATKHDLAQLEQRLDLRFEAVDLRFDRLRAELVGELHRTLNAQTKTLFFGIVTVLTAIAGLMITLVR